MPYSPLPAAPSRNGNGVHVGPSPSRGVGTGKYGKASIHDFDNPSKWVTVPDVKVLDEHELDGEDGKPAAYVDRAVLEEIAQNNNNRILNTGDPAPLIVGHTSDDPRAAERPVVGYAVNYRVQESRDITGKVSYAIHTDYKVRKDRESVIEDFPRRSVELWLGRKELDPIALLGGTTPERDLGVIIRKSRISGFTLDKFTSKNGVRTLDPQVWGTAEPVLHYSQKSGQVIRYAMACDDGGEDASDEESTQSYSYHGGKGMNAMKGKSCKPAGMGKMTSKKSYEASADDGMESDDLPPDMGDHQDEGHDFDGGTAGNGNPDASDDPQIASLFQSKQFQSMLAQAVQTAIQSLLAEEEGAAGGGAGPGGAPPAPGGGMEGAAPPSGTDGLAPQPDEEARIDSEGPPVRFGMNSGFAGPGATQIPSTNGDRRQPYSRNGRQATNNGSPMTRTQPQRGTAQNPEVVRLSRRLQEQDKTIKDLVIRNARIEAEKMISDFETNVEGHADGPVVFDNRDQEIEVLTNMDSASREYHVDNIRRNYRRAGVTQGPTDSRAVDALFRMSRTDAGGTPAVDDDYEPANAAEAVQLADAQTGRYTNGKPMSFGEAVKYMRERQAKTRQSRTPTPTTPRR